jgi:hypothetical protein
MSSRLPPPSPRAFIPPLSPVGKRPPKPPAIVTDTKDMQKSSPPSSPLSLPRAASLPPPSPAPSLSGHGSVSSLSSAGLSWASNPLMKSISLTSLSMKMTRGGKASTRSKSAPILPPLPPSVVEKETEAELRLLGAVESALGTLDRVAAMSSATTAKLKELSRRQQDLELLASASALTALALGALLLLASNWAALAVLALGGLGVAAVMMQRKAGPDLAAAEDEVVGLRRRLMVAMRPPTESSDSVSSSPRAVGGEFMLDSSTDEPDEATRVQSWRFNCFSGLSTLDFERDVYAKLDPAQQALFDQLNAKFEAHLPLLGTLEPHQVPDKFNRLRFLQADQYRVDAAVLRLGKTVLWRKDHVDNIICCPDWVLLRRYRGLRPRVWCGFDKHGRPLMFEKLGSFFGSDEACKGLSLEQWIQGYTYELCELMQRFREHVVRSGQYQHGIAYVGDLSHLRTMTAMRMIPFLKSLVKECVVRWSWVHALTSAGADAKATSQSWPARCF